MQQRTVKINETAIDFVICSNFYHIGWSTTGIIFLLMLWLFMQEEDPVVDKIANSTEEGKKVTRNNGEKHIAIFRRIADIKEAEPMEGHGIKPDDGS